MLIQYDIQVGDSIKIGLTTFVIEGALISSPSQSLGATLVAPAVYIPMKYLDETGLVQKAVESITDDSTSSKTFLKALTLTSRSELTAIL